MSIPALKISNLRKVYRRGTVAVEETHLDGMAAFSEVDATHTWIMNDARTRELVVQFLRAGCFENATVPSPT